MQGANDNQLCIVISTSVLSGSRAKYHFVREAVQEHEVHLEGYCSTEVMVAGMLTKALAKDRFEMRKERLLSGMQVVCQIKP
jgi:hypothetical protein